MAVAIVFFFFLGTAVAIVGNSFSCLHIRIAWLRATPSGFLKRIWIGKNKKKALDRDVKHPAANTLSNLCVTFFLRKKSLCDCVR